jgi:hypothetical protein
MHTVKLETFTAVAAAGAVSLGSSSAVLAGPPILRSTTPTRMTAPAQKTAPNSKNPTCVAQYDVACSHQK